MSDSPRPDGKPRVDAVPDGTFRLTWPDGRTVPGVQLRLAWPVRFRDRYIVVLDKRNKEVLTADSLDTLAPACHDGVRAELDRRYVESKILRILKIRLEFKVSYWTVETDRGRCEFVIEESDHNPERLTETEWRIIDSAGGRYRIPDLRALDEASLKQLDRLVELPPL